MAGLLLLNRQKRISIQGPRLKRFALRLSQRLRITEGEFTIVLTNDRVIRRFNRDYRNKNKATDVLSFPAQGQQQRILDFENRYLGDIMISVETAQRQAFDRNHSLETELCILMLHGLLHLLGYNHKKDQGQMRRKELRLQKELL